MSTQTDIADALAAELNGQSFSLPFTAARKWLAELKLPDLSDTLHVTVVPGTIAQVPATRLKRQGDYQVQIGVRKRPASVASTSGEIQNELLDALSDLVEEIDDYLAGVRSLAGQTVTWLASELVLPFSPEHLAEFNQFTAVLSVTYRTWRTNG